jgi:outer membrane immunogenic protein
MIKWREVIAACCCVSGIAASGPVLASGPTPYMPFNWSGLYLGGHVGGGWANADWRVISENSPFWDNSAGTGTKFTQDIDGWLGGGHVGVLHQFDRWVIGGELSLSGGNVEGSRLAPSVSNDDLRTTKLNSLFLATLRLGYALDGNFLAYIKGGYAGANVDVSVVDDTGPNVGTWKSSEWQNGWTIGGGLEFAVSPNVLLGVEYNYADLGRERHSGATSDGGTAVTDVDVNVHTVWARLSFKFGRDDRRPAPLK